MFVRRGMEAKEVFLISENRFAKIPTEKKTLYMELNVENKKEAVVRQKIQNILEEENKRRRNVSATGVEDQSGEAGIFCISKSELLENAKDYIQGNRIIFGSISIVLLMAGVTNYLNIVVTGIFSRKKELEIMGEEHIGYGFDLCDSYTTASCRQQGKQSSEAEDCLKDHGDAVLLTAALLQQGISQETVRKIMGENFLNYFLKILPETGQ